MVAIAHYSEHGTEGSVLVLRFAMRLLCRRHTENSSSLDSVEESADGVFFDVAMKQLEEQQDQIESIDSKTLNVFLIASSLFPIATGFVGSTQGIDASHAVTRIAIGTAFLSYAFSSYNFLLAYRIAAWSYRPNLKDLQTHFEGRTDNTIRRWIGKECIASYYSNAPNIRKKGKYAHRVFWGLIAEVAALAVALVAPLFT